MGDARFAADITAGVGENKGNAKAFGLDADIPALLRQGASGGLGGLLDFPRDTLMLGSRWAEIPLEVHDMGHYILSVADFDGRRGGRGRGPTCPAPMVVWACTRRRPSPEFVAPARRLVCAV